MSLASFPSSSNRRVLLVGWDAADWKVAAPLVDAGKMPNLERLIANGVMGNIATLYPVLSPMLWTSIATGKRAYKHGVHGFAEPDPRTGNVRPITSLSRRCKAIWNILNQTGRRPNVVGWWPSHPAEPIDGVMVSNHFQRVTAPVDKEWPLAPGTIHPASRADRLKTLRLHPGELDAEQILPFVPRAAQVDLSKDKRIASLAKVLAETASIHAVATGIMQTEPWDFMAVYFDGIDHFSHGFMRYHPPRLEWVSEEDFEIYKGVIDGAYQFHDMMLGALLHLAGPDTTVILMSDHGFHADHLRPRSLPNEPAGPADEHRGYGMFVMSGEGIRRDELVFGASLLDVAPTILALFGLPVGRDMDGRPIASAFEESPRVELIDSWEQIPGDDGRHPPETQFDAGDAQESLRQLVALGYIEKPDENREKALAQTVRELRHNLARSYMGASLFDEAARIFDQLWDEFPDESRFGLKLFECRLALGRHADARATLDRLIASKTRYAAEAADALARLREEVTQLESDDLSPEQRQRMTALVRKASVNTATFAYLRGCLLQAEGNLDEALAQFTLAEGVQVHNQPSLYLKIGECHLARRDWVEAERAFSRSLELDPISSGPHLGLSRARFNRGRPAQALKAATAALGLNYANSSAHFMCGRALERLRRHDEAIASYQTAISQNPVYPEAHRRLAELLSRRGEHDQAQQHREYADAADARIAASRDGFARPDDVDLDLDVDLTREAGIGEWLRPAAQSPLTPETLVVVSGLPRSGTSMMMQMLAAGGVPVLTDGARAADESNPRGYYEFEAAKRLGRDQSWIGEAKGKAVKLVAQLLPALPPHPDIRIIFMQRPLGAVVESQWAMLARLDRAGAATSDRQLAAAYRQQLALVRKTIAMTGDAVSVLPVSYNETLRSPAATAAAVNRFLGGQLDEAAMVAAVVPELQTVVATSG